MKTYAQGEKVTAGMYVSLRRMDIQLVSAEEPVLGGKPGAQYRRVPLALIIVFGPVLGGLYAISFPLVIFGALLYALFLRVVHVRAWRAGEPARRGVYVGLERLSLSHVTAMDEPLPGVPGSRYLRIPTTLLAIGSALAGGAFVVFFPIIVAVLVVAALLKVTFAPVQRLWSRVMLPVQVRAGAPYPLPDAPDRRKSHGRAAGSRDDREGRAP